jgi:hypothetical protein
MSEKVEHEVSGLHFQVGDPESLAETLLRAAETPGLWERLHKGIPPVYDIRDNVQVVHNIYDRLLNSNGASMPAEVLHG